MYWINGQPATELALSDRGLQYGDGCFTTAKIVHQHIQFFASHIQRLQHTAKALRFAEVEWAALEVEMQRAAQTVDEGVLKVILTRSQGRGYSPDPNAAVTRIIMVTSVPTHYEQWKREGATLMLSSIRLSRNPLLAGFKHLNRLEQVLIRAELDQQGAQEGIVLDTEGFIVEACAANIFWRKGNQVFTPKLDYAGVAGIMRQHILSLLEKSSYQCTHVAEPLETLATADEVIICNALMPLIPVQHAHNWFYDSRQLYDELHPFC